VEKYIKVSQSPSFSLHTYEGRPRVGVALEKTSDAKAQADWLERIDRIDPRVVSWIKKSSLDHDKYTYVIVVPLGADESWEETVNGDAFERKWLRPENKEWGHKTFETQAKAYQHHRNTDPEQGYGDLPLTLFNDDMDRVEGIWRLDHAKAREVGAYPVIDAFRGGREVSISMGCRVPHDVCSVCGNKAKNPTEYCRHPMDPGFGHVYPDTGIKVRVTNPWPGFFDLSNVRINAAPEAHPLGWVFPELEAVLKSMTTKSSSARIIVPSSYLAAAYRGTPGYGLSKTSSMRVSGVKLADMIKIVPDVQKRVIGPLQASEKGIPEEELEKAASACHDSPMSLLSNLAGLGIVLRPNEFRQSMLRQSALPLAAWPSIEEEHIREGFEAPSGPKCQFLDTSAVSPWGVDKCRHLVRDRSILFPHLGARISRMLDSPPTPKVTIQVSTDDPRIGRLYGKYLKEMAFHMARMVREMIAKVPQVADDLHGDTSDLQLATRPLGGTGTLKRSELCAQAVLPSAYLFAHAGSSRGILESIEALNTPATAHLFGGMYGAQE
jgi:hypothetical protein